jgi:hypothetical protein
MNNETSTETSTLATSPKRRFGKIVTATAVAGLAVVSLGAGAAHAQGTSGTAGDAGKARLEKACQQVPDRIARVEKAEARIKGDVNTRGSLAWLDARIAKATSNNHPDLAEVLTNVKSTRTLLIPVLDQRLVTLKDIQAKCQAHGVNV